MTCDTWCPLCDNRDQWGEIVVMKILITGPAGCLWHSIATALRRDGHDVRGLTRDATSKQAEALLAPAMVTSVIA